MLCGNFNRREINKFMTGSLNLLLSFSLMTVLLNMALTLCELVNISTEWGESNNFFKNFTRLIPSSVRKFSRKSFARKYNLNVSKWLVSLQGSLVLQWKILFIYLFEIFRQVKVTDFSFGDENFARQSFAR